MVDIALWISTSAEMQEGVEANGRRRGAAECKVCRPRAIGGRRVCGARCSWMRICVGLNFLVWKPLGFTLGSGGRTDGPGVRGCRRDCEKVRKMIQKVMKMKMKMKAQKAPKAGRKEMTRTAATFAAAVPLPGRGPRRKDTRHLLRSRDWRYHHEHEGRAFRGG